MGSTRGPAEPKRRWVPLTVIAAGAIAFGVIATGLGAGGSTGTATGGITTTTLRDAATTTPPTTTTPPRSLSRLFPAASEPLQMIVLGDASAGMVTWDPDAAAPDSVSLLVQQPQAASFNADGTRYAALSGAVDATLVIGRVDGSNLIHLPAATNGLWHPTDPNLIAWTGPADSGTGETIISVADLSGSITPRTAPLLEITVTDGPHLLSAWGDWGFATQNGDRTVGFDADGVPVRSADGELFDSAPDGTLLVVEPTDDLGVPFLLNPDGTRTEIPSLDVGGSDYRFLVDGDWIVAITGQEDGHTSILAKAVNTRSTRITSVEEPARVVGTSFNDRFLVLQEEGTNDLIFKDWSNGAQHRVPFDDQVEAIYLNHRRTG